MVPVVSSLNKCLGVSATRLTCWTGRVGFSFKWMRMSVIFLRDTKRFAVGVYV